MLGTRNLARRGTGLLLSAFGFWLSATGMAQNTYTVQPGDSLRDLADRFNTEVVVLEQLNGLEGDTLQPGQVIKLRVVRAQPVPQRPQSAQTLRKATPTPPNAVFFQRGTASWYGPRFHGKATASGERFNTYTLTAAHRTLPFGTRVRITNLANGRSVIVRINDRGPFTRGRIIDISQAAAREIGMNGTARVIIEILK